MVGNRSVTRLFALVLWASMVSGLLGVTQANAAEKAPQDQLQRLIQVLDYLGADYSSAVHNGKVINRGEYTEMKEFVDRAQKLTANLPSGPTRERLRNSLTELGTAVAAQQEATRITGLTTQLKDLIVAHYEVQETPEAFPNLAHGQSLYESRCAQCHGLEGNGKGPMAAGLEPSPTNFNNRDRADQRSPFGYFTTITHGVEDTAMQPYGDQLSASQRWDLAFYLASFAFPEQQAKAGKERLTQAPEHWATLFPDLHSLAAQSNQAFLEEGPKGTEAVLAYLRHHPRALQEQADVPLAVARQNLAASLAAFRAGNYSKAQQEAGSAYLEGFERIESQLNTVAPQLRVKIEEMMADFRAQVGQATATETSVASLYDQLLAALDQASTRLDEERLSSGVTFLSSFGILAREGLEALLVVAAIISVLVRMERREGLPYVHLGWILALFGGGATWFAAQALIEIGGASRELVEGISGLLAAAILFYVSYWFITKIELRKWQAFIHAKVNAAVNRGAMWLLTLVVFLAVYRELFETILFYQSLWMQSASGTAQLALVWGIVAGLVLLVGLGWGIFRASIRLPLRAFFSASSGLLFLLAVVLAGKGMVALQEAGVTGAVAVPFFSFELLGIYPYLGPLLVQGLLLMAMVIALAVTFWSPASTASQRNA